jgi:hypothetical protein
MKNLMIAVLIFFSGSVFAMGEDDVYVTDNDAGGKIYLFSYQCPVPGLSDARVSLTTSQQHGILGCWALYDNKVIVVWFPEESDPVKAVYEPDDFSLEKTL